jgi:ankyrin repeat protein
MSGSTPPRPARALPAVPNLEQQRKQARELLDAAHRGDPDALRRFREHHPQLGALQGDGSSASELSLHHAQLVIAREYGFASWPKLKAHIETALGARHTRLIERELAYYDDRAHGLLEVLVDGAASTIEQVRSWHPEFTHAPDDAIRSAARTGAFTLDDARLVYAREHGFSSWQDLARYLSRLSRREAGEPFMQVVEAGKRLDFPRVLELLHAHPDLVRARGTNGNTLLNLACGLAPCAVPASAEERDAIASMGGDRLAPVRLLLASGADPHQANDRGWTPLHQAGYRNDPAMAALLLEAGARIDAEAHGSGGTPLVIALFWGHREAAERLAEAGIVPRNLRVAAGLGLSEFVDECFASDEQLTAAAKASRGFYRPHSGFPTWRPSDDPQEVLDEALVWAAKSDRTEVMPRLVERGARVNADPYRGTPLIWAATKGRIAAARWLIEHGAEVNQRATFGGPSHGKGVTALHLAAQSGQLAMVKFLLDRGAEPTIRDELYGGTALGWAEHGEAMDVVAYLKAAREVTG